MDKKSDESSCGSDEILARKDYFFVGTILCVCVYVCIYSSVELKTVEKKTLVG